MNFWTYLHAFCCIAFSVGVFYVIIKNPYSVLNWVLSMLFFYFAFWSACNAALYNTGITFEKAMFAANLQSVGWSNFITYYFLFILFLTNSKKLLKNPFTYIILIIAPMVFIYQTYQGNMTECCTKVFYGAGVGWKITPWSLAFFTYYTVLFLAGVYILFMFRKRTKIRTEKKIAEIMLAGAIAVFVLGTLINVVMKRLGVYLPLDANVTFLIFECGLIYCAEKYEMLSLTGERIADKITGSIKEGLILLGRDGEIFGANNMALEIFGYEDEKPGEFPIEQLENAMRLVPENVKNGINDFEMRIKTPKGEERAVFVSVRELESGAAESGSVCIVRDITEKKKDDAELAATVEELKRSNEELERFAYVASHDLKEPLRMVASYVQLLKKKSAAKFNAEEMDYINFASDGAMRMDDLINDLLNYSRIRTKGQEFSQVDINLVVERVKDILRFKMQDKKAEIMIEGKLPVLQSDTTQLEQLFQNLIENALKFSGKESPVIRIKAVKKDGIYEFSVKDNGIGIDMQFKDRIFQIFQRLHTRDEYEGTGIGLAICKKIVECHRGKIWVESEGEGKGSVFYFTLPG